ncbi:helix-turn-helix transcriptional regulator [Streptomyces sp. NPDC089915]|uniref:helix-turn-helix transcriptional regulator n=1 Tax=Streptomyces sp. NPDC089915 TaxID=3155186 RepID=UPI00342F3103
MASTHSPLGEFLRARRAGVRPQDAGIAGHGPRRVPGLRREEVAVLAGVNSDYYTRLEQGRERRPSAQLAEALGRALRLDADARAHLHRLAGTTPDTPPPGRPEDAVDPALLQLLDGQRGAAAFVINRALDVLAANSTARELHAPFGRMDNLARMVFLDPASPGFYLCRAATAESTVGHLRQAAGIAPRDARLREVVGSLRQRSAEFERIWNRHAVRGKTRGTKRFLHPDAGPLTVTYLVFDARGEAEGQQLVVYQAAPGTADARALAGLATGALHDDRPARTAGPSS